MTKTHKGIAIAVAHVALVGVLGVKLLYDRTVLPRVWVEVAPFDPDLPIRGRYVSLQVKATGRGFIAPPTGFEWGRARLSVDNDRLVATRIESSSGESVRVQSTEGVSQVVLATPVAYFIPEHVPDPSRTPGLVVEVTVPRKGPPRPIRLGVRDGDRVRPLDD